MSYIINYFHPKIETNIETIPEIDIEQFKMNNVSLNKIAFLKNIKLEKKNILNMLTKSTSFSKFNMRTFAESYEKSNVIDQNADYSVGNIQGIIDVLFPPGKNIILNKQNYIILRTTWNQKYKLQTNYKRENTDNTFDITIHIDFKQGDTYTLKDKLDISCEDRYTRIEEDIRELFKRKKVKKDIPIPVAQPVKGGRKRSRKKNTYKKGRRTKRKGKRSKKHITSRKTRQSRQKRK